MLRQAAAAKITRPRSPITLNAFTGTFGTLAISAAGMIQRKNAAKAPPVHSGQRRTSVPSSSKMPRSKPCDPIASPTKK